jgi:hypothetical protein
LVEVGPPNDAVRIFRETLLRGGLEIPPEALDIPTDGLTRDICFLSVDIDYPSDRSYLLTGEPLRIRMSYEAHTPVDDCIFAVEVHDPDGNRLLGTNTRLLGYDLGVVEGTGEFIFTFASVPLLDGQYLVSVGMHNSFGRSFDQRYQRDTFSVQSDGREVGRVRLAVDAELYPDHLFAERTAS